MNNLHKIGLITKFNNCAYSPTVSTFEDMVGKFTGSDKAIATDFLRDLAPQNWANAYFRGNRYGKMCSNASESFNNWITEAHHLPITRLVDSIRTRIMWQMSTWRDTLHKWARVICPKMEKRIEKSYNTDRSWNVSQSNSNVYEFHSNPSVMVDVDRRTCSCFQWQINGFPCVHAIVAARRSGRDLCTLIEPYFHVSEYRFSYTRSIMPIPTMEQPQPTGHDYVILPPTVKQPPGKPKKKRIPFHGEEVQPIRCSKCGRMGNHNRKTCKELI
ncbi:uncharacterized protein LOC114311135 [Camellia sinensis]|uniref:uncharacterized protein LOC114311135 n=1 Tax=Camellia sinensis TaxID=4442 RepID=UPI0010360637|nr:uncharacterized protein LOC114311135 [Camellia sinensis]